MSYWAYVNGTITVSPMGRTQPEKRYILETALNHLPIVSGSEGDMNVYIIQKSGYNCSSSHDEFGETTNNLTDRYGCKNRKSGWMQTQDEYILVVDAALRDRKFNQTFREFMKWIVRLGKRISIENVLVEITGNNKSTIIRDKDTQNKKYSYQSIFGNLFEVPSWASRNKDREPNWVEYLMWDRAKGSHYPMLLAYKYFADEGNDEEVERRLLYQKG